MAGKSGRSGRPKRMPGVIKAGASVEFPPALYDGVTGRGLAFLEEARQYDNWTPASRVLLRQAALLIDQLEAKRGKRGEDATLRLLVMVLSALPFKNGAPAAKPEAKWKAAA